MDDGAREVIADVAMHAAQECFEVINRVTKIAPNVNAAVACAFAVAAGKMMAAIEDNPPVMEMYNEQLRIAREAYSAMKAKTSGFRDFDGKFG